MDERRGLLLQSLMIGRQNNFDFIRFFAASLVVFSHSYMLSLGHGQTEPLMVLTNGQTTLGHLAVMVFFITSGFLITQSFDKSRDPFLFLKARILRIFPALILVALLSVFLLGPLVTTLSIDSYFTSKATYDYLGVVLFFPMKYFLPGVFEQNVYEGVVNGSLWTLGYEFICYIIVLLFGILGFLKKRFFLLTMFFITYLLSFLTLPVGNQFFELYSSFAIGGIIYLFRDKFPINDKLAIISVISILLSMFTNYFVEIFTIFGGYIILYLAYTPRIQLHQFGKYGDFSYGIYIFAFPIQQMITYIMGGQMNHYLNFILAYPLVLIFAFISWHLVEKNSLKLKNINKHRIPNYDRKRELF